MTRVKIEAILNYLETDIRRALGDAVASEMKAKKIDERGVFRAFKRAVSRRCSTWERVPDRYVKVDKD